MGELWPNREFPQVFLPGSLCAKDLPTLILVDTLPTLTLSVLVLSLTAAQPSPACPHLGSHVNWHVWAYSGMAHIISCYPASWVNQKVR